MVELSMLPRSWVERLFRRIDSTYGIDRFSGRFASGQLVNGSDAGVEAALETWAHDLRGFSGDDLAYALENMDPKFPPSSKEFAVIARRAPKKDGPKLEHKIDPEQLARGLEKLKTIERQATKSANDMIAWARKPRSQLALQFVIDLANKGERDFVEILQKLRDDGHVSGNTLMRRWDYASSSWVAVGS